MHRQRLQRHRSADLEHRPQSAVRLPGRRHRLWRRVSLIEDALEALTVFYAQALVGDRIKVNALAPGAAANNLNPRAANLAADPAEAAAGAVRFALLPDDGATGRLFSCDGTAVVNAAAFWPVHR